MRLADIDGPQLANMTSPGDPSRRVGFGAARTTEACTTEGGTRAPT
jgi:hypothetical protein